MKKDRKDINDIEQALDNVREARTMLRNPDIDRVDVIEVLESAMKQLIWVVRGENTDD